MAHADLLDGTLECRRWWCYCCCCCCRSECKFELMPITLGVWEALKKDASEERKKNTKLNEKKTWGQTKCVNANGSKREKNEQESYTLCWTIWWYPNHCSSQTPKTAQSIFPHSKCGSLDYVFGFFFLDSPIIQYEYSIYVCVYVHIASGKMADRQQQEKSFCKINLFVHRIFFSFFRCMYNVQIWKMNSFKLRLNFFPSCFNFSSHAMPCHHSI